MEGLAMALFFVTLIGIIASIVLIIYSAIKKDFKYRPKRLAVVLGIFIVAFIGSTIFYGSVQSPESKAKYEASQKAKDEEKAQKELAEKEKKANEENKKQEDQQVKENLEATVEKVQKEDIPVVAEVKEEAPKVDDRFTITSNPNTTAVVDELIKKGKENASTAQKGAFQEAVKFINDNYNKYWVDNETMHKVMYYGSLLQYSNENNDIKNLGVDAVQVVKYVYRKAEKIEDSSTQSNLKQIKKSLDKIPDEYKK